MKTTKTFFVLVFLFGTTYFAHTQTVCEVKYVTGADIKVYVTSDPTAADLVVFQTSSADSVTGNNGVWYFSPFINGAQKKIFFVDMATDADLSISFTTSQGSAGWINSAKSSVMN